MRLIAAALLLFANAVWAFEPPAPEPAELELFHVHCAKGDVIIQS